METLAAVEFSISEWRAKKYARVFTIASLCMLGGRTACSRKLPAFTAQKLYCHVTLCFSVVRWLSSSLLSVSNGTCRVTQIQLRTAQLKDLVVHMYLHLQSSGCAGVVQCNPQKQQSSRSGAGRR